MTARFIRACENPYVHVIGHPTARKMGRRPSVDVDFAELFLACARTGTALEVNSHPDRLDLPSGHIRAARDAGVKFAIDSDAHSTRRPGEPAVRCRPGAARLADLRRRDQHLATAEAAELPAQGPLEPACRHCPGDRPAPGRCQASAGPTPGQRQAGAGPAPGQRQAVAGPAPGRRRASARPAPGQRLVSGSSPRLRRSPRLARPGLPGAPAGSRRTF